MVNGFVSSTNHIYRIENGSLCFDGRNLEHDAGNTEVVSGTDEDACFASEFLSCKIKNFVLLNQNLEILRGYVDEDIQKSPTLWNAISFGVLCNDAENAGAICEARPSAIFHPIPYKWDDLKIIGALLNREIASPTVNPLQCQKRYYEQAGIKLEAFVDNIKDYEGTVFMNMAKATMLNHEPYCMFYSSPYDDGFADRFVCGLNFDESDVCVVTFDIAEKCFGKLPLSYRMSVMGTMPVRIKATDEFKSETGYNGETVDVVMANAHNLNLNKFMGYWSLLSQKDFFWTKRISSRKRTPVFLQDGFGFCDDTQLTEWRRKFGLAGAV